MAIIAWQEIHLHITRISCRCTKIAGFMRSDEQYSSPLDWLHIVIERR